MTINILGADYNIRIVPRSEDEILSENDGYCDDSVKVISVVDYAAEEENLASKLDTETVKKKVLRHEITHAFLLESGLGENCDWAENEEAVDWIAMQGPKIYKAWQEAGAL